MFLCTKNSCFIAISRFYKVLQDEQNIDVKGTLVITLFCRNRKNSEGYTRVSQYFYDKNGNPISADSAIPPNSASGEAD